MQSEDVDGDDLSYVLLSQPNNGVLSGDAPNLHYTPNPNFHGEDSFTFKVDDGEEDSNVASVTITVTPINDTPVADDQSLSLDEDRAVSIDLTGSDIDGDSLSFAVQAQPINGVLSGDAPNLVYTPNVDFNGNDSFTFKANDGELDSSLATVSIVVNPVNDAPTADAQSLSLDEDTSADVILTGSDIENQSLTYSLLASPLNGTLSGNAPDLVYTPNADFNGNDSFTFKANDGELDSSLATVSIVVNPVNDAPTADAQSLSLDEDTSADVTLTGSDIENQSLTYSVLTFPLNGTLSGNAPDLVYTPNADFNGNDLFTFKTNDGELDSSLATVSIVVNPINDSPTADAQSLSLDEDTSASVTLTGSDIENQSLTYSVLTFPLNGTLSGNAPNLVYTPNADFNGNDLFTFKTNDGELDSSLATVSIVVNSVNDAPVANDKSISTDEELAVLIELSGSDADGDILSYSVQVQPINGMLSGTAPSLIYTPNLDFNGSDSFTFIVNDGSVNSDLATVSITVTPVNDAPIGDDQNLATDEGDTILINLTGSDSDGDVLSYSVQIQPANGSLSGTAPDLTYTPNLGFSGDDSFTFVVNDGAIDSLAANIQITVVEVNNPPEIISTISQTSVHVATGFNYDVDAIDVDGDTLVYQLEQAPEGMTIDPESGVVNWVPTVNQIGDHNVTVTATDELGLNDIQSFVLAALAPLNQSPEITSTPITTANVGVVYSYQLEAVDPEGEELTYSLIDGPDGLTINSQTGLISWLPDTLATQDISVNVADPLGLSDTQVWSVVIDDLDALCEFEAPSELITLYGLVTNVNTGLPIAGALVELLNDSNILSITTGTDGNYLFTSLARGASSIEISIPAHLGVQRSLEFDGSNLFEFSVSMAPQSEAGDYIVNQTATVRDFNSIHPDFEGGVGRDPGIVGPELSADGKPIYAAPDGSVTITTTGRENFDQWYRDVDGVNLNAEIELPFVFNPETGTYSFNDNAFFPIDDMLFGNQGRAHNYHFTMEYENEFRYVGGETFDFSGDDDLWLYINDKLAIDLGFGISEGTVDLDAQADQLGIEIGGVYSIKMFFAERHTVLSRFNAETSIGLTALSGFEAQCGAVYFRSVAPQFVTAGSEYQYVARAKAASGEPIIYSLSNAPAGMVIDGVTGLLSWSTSNVDEGLYSVAIVAATAQGQQAQQQYVISVTTDQRIEPNISSAPIFLAAAGDTYEYPVEVFDSTSTGIRLELLNGPDAMQVIGNSLSWEPEISDIGDYTVSITVSNGYDQHDTQTWVLTVFDPSNGIPNLAPVVESLPPSNQVTVGSTFIYPVIARDPEGLALNFALGQAPIGMTISANGEIVFTAQAEQLGTHPVEIIVTDPLGGQASQSFDLLVAPDVADNQAPIIVSQPSVQAIVDQPYVYQVLASDDDGDTLTYRLSSAPAGMSINANSGEITWQPSAEQLGEKLVVVRTEDGRGGSATQSYSVFVNASTPNNRPPVITSTSIVTARVDLVYNYQVQAIDEDGDTLTYSVIEGPSGLTISPTGLVSWSPTSVESVVVVVRASDQQAYVEQGWQLNVQPANAVLSGQILITPKVADEAEIVTIQAQAENAIGAVSVSVTVNGVDYDLDQNNQVQVIAGGIGVYEVVATIGDDTGVIEVNDRYTVRDPNDSDAPLASFDSLVDGQIITAPIDIIGSVEDPNINTWQLISRAKSAKADEFTVLASGTTNVINESFGQFDPSLVRNGQYTIFLIAEDASGQTTQESVTVLVDRDLKVGNFSITFEDLSIPLGGIPISVRRTYDSRDRAQSRDFGFGWSLDYQNVKVEESRTLGLGWSQNEYATGPQNTLVNVCTEPKGAPIVSVTLPDGDVERFEVGASPRCNLLLPVNRVDLTFTSVGDTQTSLEAVRQTPFYFKNDSLTLDIDSDQLANPDQYRLTTRAGFVYDLDQDFGVSKVTDPNGNTLTYSDDGIVHSDGKRVDFVRDALGRVTQVIDPMGRALNYAYNNNGDLLSVTERDSAVTSFTYNQSHGLLDIIDPLGRNIVRNIYDDDGRLIAQQDSDGLRTEFTHNLSGRESVIRDRNGHTQFLYYDDNGYVTSQVDALGNTTGYTLDANGNELTQTNALGNTTVATYNTNNDQLTQTDALGNVTSFEYNQRGKETEISDARGNVFVNSYDAVGNLLKVTDPLGNFAGNNINRHGLPTNLVDVLMNVTTFTYDDEGNKLTETDAQDNLTSFSYDANNNVLSETSTRLVNGVAVEETATFEYDSRDRVIKTIDALGNETQSVYDLVGNQVALIDALGRRTEMQYDVYKRLLKTNYPDGTTQGNSYDPEGNLLTEADRLGRVTTHEYDALNRLIKSTQADGSITRTEYDAIGRVAASVDANGNRTINTYDAADRRISTTDALGNLTQFAYDADGNMVQMTDANGNVTTYTYNELDQKVQTTFQNGSTMLDGLDALSRKTSSTDQAGVLTNYEYDKLGRLIKVIDALAQETTYTYDSRGNKLTQTDAEGRTTNWRYDALGRVISRTLPLGQIESMQYDAIGNVTQSTDFNGQVTTYSYDVNDRVIGISYEGGLSETYVYDAAGNHTQTSKTENGNTSTWTYTYDNLNRLKTDTQFIGTADEVTLSYNYDAQGNRVMLTETSATATRVTRYSFDVLNRMSSVQDPDGNTTTYSYDAAGNRIGMSHENGIQTAYAYDELNRLTSLAHKDSANVTLRDFSYTLLANGRRKKITEASGRITDYTFDDLYRLTEESIFDPVNPSHNAAYTYDKVGNRTFEVINSVSTAYTIDANDRLIQTGGTVYTHDAQGNTLTETLDGNVTRYRYNAKQELTESIKEGITTAYLYNVNGTRIGQGNATSQTVYTLDNNRSYAQVITETIDLVEAVNYTYGDDLVSQKRDTVSTYHYDGLGSTRALSNGAGSLTDSYDYDAFGEVLNQTGSSENNYLFTGEQFDSNLDQYYLRARYYDQGIGRFTQMDTWMGVNSDPVTLHKYLYANVDPVNFTDPTGNFGLGSFSAAARVNGILSAVSAAQTAFDVFSAATDEDGLTAKEAGLLLLTSLAGKAGGKLLKLFSRKGCNSFDGDTLVATENGLRPIKEIKIGDKVWAYNEETGEKSLQEVVHLIFGEGAKRLVDITLDSGEVLTATAEHPFYVDSDWVNADDLTSKNDLLSLNGQNIGIEFVKQYKQKLDVYNLTVANDHTYYVGADKTLSHNANKCAIDFGAPKPKLFRHKKHQSGGPKGGKLAGLEPQDSFLAFERQAFRSSKNGNWYARSTDGKSIYRYFPGDGVGNKGGFHWSGSTGDLKSPLSKSDIPSKIITALGFKAKGPKL